MVDVSMYLGRSTTRIASEVIILSLGAALSATAQPAPELPVEAIVQKMIASEEQQKKNLRGYRATRAYRLSNEDGSKVTEVIAKISYDQQGRKRIDVVEERGSEGLFRRAIQKVVDTEMKASAEDRGDIRIGPENYDFRLAGVEVRDGNRCYVLDLIPKKKSKFLMEGRMWVDAQDFAVARIQGRPAANISFWVGKPYITQSFQKVGDVWLLARNESTTKAKIVGLVTFTMETREVESEGVKVALKPAPRPRRSTPPSD